MYLLKNPAHLIYNFPQPGFCCEHIHSAVQHFLCSSLFLQLITRFSSLMRFMPYLFIKTLGGGVSFIRRPRMSTCLFLVTLEAIDIQSQGV